METKSAVLGAAGMLLAGGLAFAALGIANAENQPAPAPSVTAAVVAPEPTPEPVVTTKAPEPAAEPAPVVIEPAPVVVEPVPVAPVAIEPAPVYVAPAPVYVAPEPVNAPQPTYMPGVTVGATTDGQVNKPADPNDIKNAERVPLPAPKG
jgi:hypothetical protein